MSNFDDALHETLRFEGEYSNDPGDPGGETKWGISHAAYPDLDIRNLTIHQAAAIYRRDYWDALGLDRIEDGRISGEIFDTAVNMGTGTAVRILQDALNFLGEGLAVDGEFGPQTVRAANDWARRDVVALFKAMNGFQFIRYVEIVRARGHRFARGWMKRIQQIKEV